MVRCAPTLLLAGCPYVFGPADLSNVETDAPAPTGDTAPDTDPTGPTGDTGPVVVGPTIVELLAYPAVQGVDLLARFTPSGALAAGGTLLVSDGVAEYEVAILPSDPPKTPPKTVPTEVATVFGGDRVRWTLPVADACDGLHVTASVSLRDAGGAVGPLAGTTLDIPGFGRLPEQAAVQDVGTLTPPVLFCGAVDQPADSDRLNFLAGAPGEVVFVLAWEDVPNSDLDYTIYADMVQVAYAFGTVNPEILSGGVLEVGPQYTLDIFHFSGTPTFDWLMAVLPAAPSTPTTPSGTGDTGP